MVRRISEILHILCTSQIIVHYNELLFPLNYRYQKERPPLSINIVHFNQSLTQDGLHNIPFAHIKTLTCFQSRVAQ